MIWRSLDSSSYTNPKELEQIFFARPHPRFKSNYVAQAATRNKIKTARRWERGEGGGESCALNLTLHVDGYGYANSSSSNLPLLRKNGVPRCCDPLPKICPLSTYRRSSSPLPLLKDPRTSQTLHLQHSASIRRNIVLARVLTGLSCCHWIIKESKWRPKVVVLSPFIAGRSLQCRHLNNSSPPPRGFWARIYRQVILHVSVVFVVNCYQEREGEWDVFATGGSEAQGIRGAKVAAPCLRKCG